MLRSMNNEVSKFQNTNCDVQRIFTTVLHLYVNINTVQLNTTFTAKTTQKNVEIFISKL